MPSTICTPISGRVCLLASALFLSVFGLLVVGSLGSLSQTRLPHSAPPQLAILTWLSRSAVNQVPVGSAASAGAIIAPSSAKRTAAAANKVWVRIATSAAGDA